jgi:hypothetical protein
MADERTPWKTDEWFTSPWNHDPAVAGSYAFPDQIQIHDVTLRDGEQQAGVEFTADDKIRIAEALAEAGVQRIEAGLPAVSPEDEKAVRAIADRGLPSEIYAFSRCMIDDAKRAVDCGVDGVVMEIPSSRHLIEMGYRWSVDKAVELSVEATSYAHEQGLKVAFFPIDATRAALDDYLDLMERVARDGHMDTFVLVDTFGVLGPQAVPRFVEVTRDRLQVPLETHFHMDYSLGVANSLIAAANGASVIQTTIAGVDQPSNRPGHRQAAVRHRASSPRGSGMCGTRMSPSPCPFCRPSSVKKVRGSCSARAVASTRSPRPRTAWPPGDAGAAVGDP